MAIKRQYVISVLLLITSLCIGNLMFIATVPAHEFGHYITAKSFGWNVTEVDWFSHVTYSEESLDNAPHSQKIAVSIVGVILAPIIPYILTLLVIKRSVIRDILALPYLMHGILGSVSDLKKVMWWLLTSVPMPRAAHQILNPMNLVISILTGIGMIYLFNMIIMDRYKQCVIEIAIVIDELDDHDEETQINEE